MSLLLLLRNHEDTITPPTPTTVDTGGRVGRRAVTRRGRGHLRTYSTLVGYGTLTFDLSVDDDEAITFLTWE